MSDAAVKSDAHGMISFSVYREAFTKQREIHEERYNQMQQCLSLEIQRLREQAAVASAAAGVDKSDTVVQQTNDSSQDGGEEATKTPSKSKKRNATTQASSKNSTTKPKRVRKPSPKRISQHEIRWNQRYQELIDYEKTHCHLNITRATGNPKLYTWINTQRTEHRFLREGKPHQISPERIQLLDKLQGWQWTVNHIKQLDWNDRYQQLLEYRAKHGHTNVPQNCLSSPTGLGNYVMEQRRMHKAYNSTGGTPKLTMETMTERVAKLDAIGFIWSLRNRGGWWEVNNNTKYDDAEELL